MKLKLAKTMWRALPKKALSRIFGRFARHPVSRHLIPWYARFYRVDTASIKRDLHEFENLLSFFVRELKSGARPIEGDVAHVVSPVDGTVSQWGVIDQGTLVQAKGISYSLEQLLYAHPEYLSRFEGGYFLTIYLSPRDYHRIHMPVQGEVEASTYVAGELYPVNRFGVEQIPGLFAINERVVTYIRSKWGMVALAKVGAMNVGSIKVVFDDEIATNAAGLKTGHKKYPVPIPLEKGSELGRFELGSTVILLFEPGQIEWTLPLAPGTTLKMGQCIARFMTREGESECSGTL